MHLLIDFSVGLWNINNQQEYIHATTKATTVSAIY